MTLVYYAVEGDTDAPVAERLIRLVGFEPHPIRVAGGKPKLDPRIPELNRSGAALNWLILRDLDQDASCASELIDRLLKGREVAPRVNLRIPVRAMESWLLADREGFAGELGIARSRSCSCRMTLCSTATRAPCPPQSPATCSRATSSLTTSTCPCSTPAVSRR